MIDSVSLTLAAGVPARFATPGEYFRLVSGTGVDVRFLKNGAVIGEADGMDSGFFARTRAGEPFDSVELVSATAQNAAFLVAMAEAGSASAVSVSGTVAVSHPVAAFTQAAPGAGLASAQILAANPARKFLLLQNTDAAANIWVNLAGAAAAAATGVKLAPGASLLLDVCCPSAAIFAISDTAGAALVAVEG